MGQTWRASDNATGNVQLFPLDGVMATVTVTDANGNVTGSAAGLVTMPPIAPSDVMVMVDPDISNGKPARINSRYNTFRPHVL